MSSDVDLEWNPLPSGRHDAIIYNAELDFRKIIALIIEYRVQIAGEDYRLRKSLPFDAPRHSSDYSRTSAGKGRYLKCLKIRGERPPKQMDHAAVTKSLLGLQVQIAVSHKITNDLASPYVADVLGPAWRLFHRQYRARVYDGPSPLRRCR